MRSWKQICQVITFVVLVLASIPAIALAAASESNNYQVNEVFFGSGGELNACSTTYCSKQSAGEVTVGNTSSANYAAQAGFNTDRQPYLQFVVNNTNIDLGKLSADTTATATAQFSVKAYLTHGYSITTASDPPTNGVHQLAPITGAPAASAAGTEQFGINLVENTAPKHFGADPTHTPGGSGFASGIVNADYSNPNVFKYNKGDQIALSTSSTSETDYTISYIFNISHVTPGGVYDMNHVLVATATY